MKKKNLIIFICAFALIMVNFIKPSLAYFHYEENKANTFTLSIGRAKNINITLSEPNWDQEKGINLMPGQVIPKDPTITNNADTSYARIIITLKDKQTGEIITNKERAEKILSMLYFSKRTDLEKLSESELSKLDRINSTFILDTSREETGIYYFNHKETMPQDTSAVLFTGIVVPADWDSEDIMLIGDYDIIVDAEAIQADLFENLQDAFIALDLK